MEETERTKNLRQATERIANLKAKYGTIEQRKETLKPVTGKKKGTLRSVIQWIRSLLPKKKKKEEYTLPSGIKTQKQLKKFQKIMKETGK